tara:strand:- start:66 stop:749 length:684 start_codon:yes stop_codon:yes gene_type:complete
MINGKKVLAIIPARKSSEELKNKNIRKFNKKPLIFWTLKAAQKSKLIDEVVVSSNSSKILNYSKKFKKFILSKRPENLSTKKSEIIDTIFFEMKKFENCKIIILLQPTSPLRRSEDIDKSLRKMIGNKRESCVSYTEIKYNPYNFYLIKKNKISFLVNKRKKIKSTNRQSFKKVFYPSGDIYISTSNRLKKKKKFVDLKTYPYIVSTKRASDIDNIWDFKTAEFKLK